MFYKIPFEKWRFIIGFSDLVKRRGYVVSDKGRLARVWENGKWELKFGSKDKDGYIDTTLSFNGKEKRCRFHRAVLEAFVEPCPKGKVGMHLDNRVYNNILSNLRWGTQSENVKQSYSEKRASKAGKNHHLSKTNEAQVLEIRKLSREGFTHQEISDRFENVTYSMVNQIVNRCTWRHV